AEVGRRGTDRGSVLWWCGDLRAPRRGREDLRSGSYSSLPSPEGVFAWRRGDGHAVVLNLGDAEATIDLAGTIVIGTRRDRDGERVDSLVLGSAEGALLEL